MMKSGGVFNQRPALNLTYKISAMDSFENLMYTGDEKGMVYRYEITPDAISIFNESSVMSKQIAKGRIDQIKCLSYAGGNLLVLAEPNLYYVDVQSDEKAEPIVKEKIKFFTINEHSNQHSLEIVAVTNKKEGIILQYSIQNDRFEQQREKFLLPDVPLTAAYIGNYFYLSSKKSYQLINLEDQQLSVANLIIDIGAFPFIKCTNQDELLVLTTNNTGIFIGREGQMGTKGSVNLLNKQFIDITVYKTYLVALFDNLIQVFNLADAKMISEMTISSNQTAKCITQSSDQLFFATNNEIIYLYLTPPEIQIKDLLLKGKVDDALSVFNQCTSLNDPDRQSKMDQLKLDCAWALIKTLQFEQSDPHLFSTNFELRDFICLFPEYIGSGQKMQAASSKKDKTNYTMTLVINQIVQDQVNQSKEKIDSHKKTQAQDYLVLAKDFLIKILENRRGLYTSPQYASQQKDKLQLLTSQLSFNQNQWLPITVEQMLELIDFALIRAYIELDKFNHRLKSFLTGNQIYCVSMFQELQDPLTLNRSLHTKIPGIQARFYESFMRVDEALEMWKKNGDSSLKEVCSEACDETIRILKQNPEKARIFKFMNWVMKSNLKIGCRLFLHIDELMISPDQMLKHFEDTDFNEELKRRIKEKYLEVLVNDKKVEEERYHTQLGYSYLDAIFKIMPKNTKLMNLQLTDNILLDYQSKFKNYLKNQNSKYNANSLLEKKVKDSWMIPELIFLYGREKRHDEALTKLIDLKEFDSAELYCCDYNDNLLTILFKKYVELYQDCMKASNPNSDSAIQYQNLIKDTMNNFLRKYSTHSQINSLEVLDLIPDKWNLSDTGDDDGLFCLLNSVISHTLHQRRSKNAAKHLSQMDLLDVECQFVSAKKPHILINTEKKCAVCGRSIGDKVKRSVQQLGFRGVPECCCSPSNLYKKQQCLSPHRKRF